MVGLGFLVAAVMVWVRREHRGGRSRAWVATVDSITTTRTAALGVVLSGANPKVVVLSLGAALSLAQADAGAATTAQALVLFSVIGALGVITPLAIYLASAERAQTRLVQLRAWLSRHETSALTILGVLIGLAFLTGGLDSL